MDSPTCTPEVILGTAQLSSQYGILQQSVECSGDRPERLLEVAWEHGVRSFDTAPRYGEAESILGRFDRPLTIHTKLEPGVAPRTSINRSLVRLARSSVEIAYLHDPDAAIRDGGRAVDDASVLIGDSIKCLGVSVYEVDQFVAGIEHPAVSVVQIPINPLSRRLADESSRRQSDSIKVYGRSLFAQGVLLVGPEQLPRQVSHLAEPITELRSLSDELERSVEELLLLWARDFPGIDGIVIGAASEIQLHRIMECLAAPPLQVEERMLLDAWSSDIEIDADPRMWK